MPTTPEFEAAYGRLNAEQREAVDAIEGPVFVIAGPGTGKTQVLTLRIAQILAKTDTPPDGILALTFTESGAMEMRERLARFIGSRAAKVRFHTFHSFAETLVNRYPDHFPRIVGGQVTTDAERAEILDAALMSTAVEYLRPFGDPLYYHGAAKSAIQTLKRENVTPAALAEKIAVSEAEFEAMPDKYHEKGKYEGKLKGDYEGLQKKIAKTRDLLAVYELYEKGLAERHRYDFDDLILEAVRALTEDEGFRREVQEGLLYILADEHQDANRAQNAILELLAEYSERPNLFIVGDEKQAIYRFQGADLDNVHYFRGRFEGTQVIVLKENYRSTQTILDNALALISASPDERLSRLPLNAQKGAAPAAPRSVTPITLATCITPDGEAAYIASEIEKLVAAGVAHDEIAILVRRNRDVLWLAEHLSMRNIPVTVGTEDALNNRYVRALLRFLALVNEPRDERLAGVLTLPGFNLSAADAWRISQKARIEKMPIIDILASAPMLAEAKVTADGTVSAQALYDALRKLGTEASIERPAVIAERALGVSGLLAGILGADSAERSEALGAVRALLTMLEELSEREHDALLPRALQLTALYEERGLQLPSSAHEASGRVKLMTVHRSKGREFRYVFLPRLTESAWSTRNRPEHFYVPDILSGANELEDERRLLYVGLTRAKEHAILSYSLTREDGKADNPTPLIEDLDDSLIEKVANEDAGIDPLLVTDDPASHGEKAARAAHAAGKPSEDDLTTLREAFLAQGLSPTALNNYLSCPWHYFYVNLLRIPEAENKFMLFGTAVHTALKAYADRRSRGEELGADYLISTFNRMLARSPLTTRDIDELRVKGEKALQAWWKEHAYSWPEKAEAELPIEIRMDLSTAGGQESAEELKLRGNLDRVDTLPNGTVRVIDYKTGKQKSRNEIMGNTASSDGNYYRQLTFYKMLLAKAEPSRVMSEGVTEFVEPDEKGSLRTEPFEITDAEVAELQALIQKSAQEILSLSFWNTTCDDSECEWCPLRTSFTKS
ncbi:MAG: ATP-dependent DNA helicase [Candidatus Pacebacteria bacterium]|nr:ATP-dependent DNA helicase [Candidatus Paceibacterota bacterium]